MLNKDLMNELGVLYTILNEPQEHYYNFIVFTIVLQGRGMITVGPASWMKLY